MNSKDSDSGEGELTQEKQQLGLLLARIGDAIIQSSEDAIISKTLDGTIRSWNAGAQRLFGYTAEEAIGRNITLLIPPDRLEEEYDILSRLRRGERIEHFETIRLTKDGRRLDISLTVSPIKSETGKVVGASKIGRDITRWKQAETGLRESEARHRFLADLAAATQPLTQPEEVMATTARLLAEYLDANRCAYAEVEDENILVITGDFNRGVRSIVGRWPAAAFGAEFLRCMLANEPFVVDDTESDPRTAPDRTAYRETQIQSAICMPLQKAGKLVAAIGVHQAVPRRWTRSEIALVRTVVGRSWESIERTRVARGLKETADHLALAFEAASLGDWSWDVGTDVVNLSARAAEIFGVPPAPHMTWSRIQGLLHPEDREQARPRVARAGVTQDQYDVQYRVTRPDGSEVWVSAKGRAQYDATGTALGMFGVVQDITETKRLEQELRQRAAELAETDRKKDDFIALLAHELRNPLAPLRAGLHVMRLAAEDSAAVGRARDMMDRQLSHMVRLIDDLLDVSRIGRHKLHLRRSRVWLSDVVTHAVEAANPAIEAAGHTLTVALPPEQIALDADLTRLAQVFGNLLSNSAKYTDPGGRIWLTAEKRGAEVQISVRDTGIGIPSAALPRLFEMFSQVDRSVERSSGGLGLGLALVKGLVETHGGTVGVESPGPGRGSTFTIRLPIAQGAFEPRPAEAGAAGAEAAAPQTVKRVLVADDNQDGAASIGELLELLGNEVHLAHDGVEALEIAERVRPDLVLMDVGMPRLDGLEATRQIRQRPWGDKVTIIALTGWGQSSDRERSRSAGCDGHLVKPVGLPQVEKLLAQLPERKRG